MSNVLRDQIKWRVKYISGFKIRPFGQVRKKSRIKYFFIIVNIIVINLVDSGL